MTALPLVRSLSNITVGAYVGILTGLVDKVNLPNLFLTLAAWLSGPLITFTLTLLIYRIVRRYVSRLSLPSLDLFNRLAVYVIVFVIKLYVSLCNYFRTNNFKFLGINFQSF
jgi:phosphate/sulfate permease